MITDPNRLPELPESDIRLLPGFLPAAEAGRIFERLLEETPWQQDDIQLFGKTYAQPRLTALYGHAGKPYTYSGVTMVPKPFTPLLQDLLSRLEPYTKARFTTCLLNLYRDGRDSNGWHADNEKSLGKNPVIASISLGATRRFKLKHREDPDLRAGIDLPPGSLLLMQGETQHRWLHEVPKTRKPVGPRINLTFRRIIG